MLALEGLRVIAITRGNYKEAQALNLRMVLACSEEPLCSLFIQRAVDTLPYVESRSAILETFSKALEHAGAPLAADLKDQISFLYYRMNRLEDARRELDGLGFVDHWQFVAGPFGSKDKDNPIDRRFAPERTLNVLAFHDESDKDMVVQKNVVILDRDLNIDALFPGSHGIFYALTNFEVDEDQDVFISLATPVPYRACLRGMPVMLEPGDEMFRRYGGDLVRTRLVKGSNPFLVKLANASSLIVRVTGADNAPVKGLRYQPLADAALAAHEVSAIRGLLFSEKSIGPSARYFLETAGVPPALPGLPTVAQTGALTFPQAIWLELALQRENDNHAREALARRILAAYPKSVYALDLSAVILAAAGQGLGNSESREAEESRGLREQALKLLPDSHQHLLALYHFFSRRELRDQAFEMIKRCADAHPDSGLAQMELGNAYQEKQFLVDAERCFEKAAELDAAFLPRLAHFHSEQGNLVRARELRKRLLDAGRLDLDSQFSDALRRGELKTAERILTQQEKWWPERKDEFNADRVRLLIENGDLKEAFALQKKFYDGLPASADKRAPLAALADLALRMDRSDQARQLLRDYLKQHPGDFELRQRLRWLEDNKAQRWWKDYDVEVSTIDASRFENKNYPSANHAWIVDFMVTKILPDLSRESYVHIAQKVLNLQGIGELSEVLVRAQQQDIVFIRTLNPDGSAYMPQNVHDFDLSRTASLYKVGSGSILEHAYLDHADADEDEPSLSMGFNFNAIDAPRAVSRWVVMIADEAKARLNIRKIRPELIDEKILSGPPGYTVYQWTNTQLEGIKNEPFMATEGDQEVIPLVLLETPDKPFHGSRWLMRREWVTIPPEAASAAKRIAAEHAGEGQAARFEAIVNWVRENIQPGTDSKTLDDVWYSKSGNNAQLALLAREMSHAVGLSVHSAYVNGSYIPGHVWRPKTALKLWEPPELASFGNGGQMLVLEQLDGVDHWAQFLGQHPKFYSTSDINGRQAGALALVESDEGVRIKRVLGEALGMESGSHHVEIVQDANGGGQINGVLQLFGFLAGNLREALSDPRRSAQIKESIVHRAWPKIQLKESTVKGGANPDSPLIFIYRGKVEGMAAEADHKFFLQANISPPKILRYQGAAERQSDLLIKEEVSELDQQISFLAPEGHAWIEVPDDIFLCAEFGFYVEDYNVKGRLLTCSRSYLMPAQRVTPAAYPALLDFLRQVSARQQQRIAYEPVKAEGFDPHPREVLSQGYASHGEEKKVERKLDVQFNEK